MTNPSPEAAARTGERIAKLLARAGVASRREVERMIADGRVTLGDEAITTANTVLPNLKGVCVDGKPVKAAEPPRLFVFHKPSGLITAERDPAGRPTIYTALRNALPPGTPRVMPIGRLDFNTEGLLLMTNDGELKRAMELPSSGIPRTYRARTFGDITQDRLEELSEGVTIDGMHYGSINANMERRTGRNQWIEVTITEGKNREVRRVLEHLGLEVSRLIRTAYGPFELLDLARGAVGEIRQVDVERFRRGLLGHGPGLTEAPATVQANRQARARIQRTRSDAPATPPKAARSEARPTGQREGQRGGQRAGQSGSGARNSAPQRAGEERRGGPARPGRFHSEKAGSERSGSERPRSGKPAPRTPNPDKPDPRRPNPRKPGPRA